jgi:hypothetical protein
MGIRVGYLVEAVDPIDDRVDRVFGQEAIHGGEMFDRSDGDADDVGILPLQAGEVGLRAEPGWRLHHKRPDQSIGWGKS